MQAITTSLYSLSFRNYRTYIVAALFVVGNIVLPQLCHLVPGGGTIWLPIYFFTLVAAYKYGIRAGLLTALLSPVVNSLLFAMPPVAVLPVILAKSVILAVIASVVAARSGKVAIWLMALVVLGYQVAGTFAEWALCGSLYTALQDFRIGIPGMLVQIFGGYAILSTLLRK